MRLNCLLYMTLTVWVFRAVLFQMSLCIGAGTELRVLNDSRSSSSCIPGRFAVVGNGNDKVADVHLRSTASVYSLLIV